MTQPIALESIYTDVNILEKITGRQRVGISELLKRNEPENFERFGLSSVVEHRVSGAKAVAENPKLMILGKPGAGKTTFMKHLAIRCIWNKFLTGRIPIFVTLKDFSEACNNPTLIDFIGQQMSDLGIPSRRFRLLLESGRAIFLFDGLDEVRPEDTLRVISQIQGFCDRFSVSKEFKRDQSSYIKKRSKAQKKIDETKKNIYKIDKELKKLKKERVNETELGKKTTTLKKIKNLEIKIQKETELVSKQEKELSKEPDISIESDKGLRFLSKENPDKFYINYFVITCRIAAKEFSFESFTEVEVADFGECQIDDFSRKWFVSKEDPVKADSFMEKLRKNKPIQELASNPLLLTLLCLVFEDSADFPANRSELYKEGIDILLKKWDAKRNIDRGQIYKDLSLQRKEDLLSKVAFSSFERGEYFFKQASVERQIKEYIQNLPNASTDSETLLLDCESILKSIEAQHGLLIERAHGIYSFSHLTFQEYFTARQIVCSAWQDMGKGFQSSLQDLIRHITEKRWREVFLLTLGMLPSADYPIQQLKDYIDSLLKDDEQIQSFLEWINKKVSALHLNEAENAAIARVFYFEFSLNVDEANRIFNLQPHEICSNSLEICLDYDLYLDLNCVFNLTYERAVELYAHRNRVLDHKDVKLVSQGLKRELERLKDQLPPPGESADSMVFQDFQGWWKLNGQRWAFLFRELLMTSRNIGHAWSFSSNQLDKLRQYHSANKLLVDFLSSDLYICREVRDIVSRSVLLPFNQL